ncbi:hypothetical protein MLD38_004843 [Melastoma candidum]|uniref:Uncharacterized protein n=1 Tax=Melastoma candidum TaxID=119954 RepID=A0ACB9S8B3_9MYRT|nr:hypothetical protein MLD38_004843 [Melastoma candidum]
MTDPSRTNDQLLSFRTNTQTHLAESLVQLPAPESVTNMLEVTVKWQKEVFPDVEIDTSRTPYLYKCKMYDLTGVPPERKKIMVKGVLLKGLKSELLEKASPSLGRSAIYLKESCINGLPSFRYLTVRFVCFSWERESKQRANILSILREEGGRKSGLKVQEKTPASRDSDVKMAASSPINWGNPQPPLKKEKQLTGIYSLVAVLTHKGRSADSGHYVAWVKQYSGKWIEFDDGNPIPQRKRIL